MLSDLDRSIQSTAAARNIGRPAEKRRRTAAQDPAGEENQDPGA